MTREEINNTKYIVCCPLCDNDKCVKGTDKCEAEIWVKNKKKVAKDQRTLLGLHADFVTVDEFIMPQAESENI